MTGNRGRCLDRNQSAEDDQLHLDTDLSRGQVRKVSGTFVDELVQQFSTNAPDVLEFVVWKEQGVCCVPLPRAAA